MSCNKVAGECGTRIGGTCNLEKRDMFVIRANYIFLISVDVSKAGPLELEQGILMTCQSLLHESTDHGSHYSLLTTHQTMQKSTVQSLVMVRWRTMVEDAHNDALLQ